MVNQPEKFEFRQGIEADSIDEYRAGQGVTIEGSKLKDSSIQFTPITAPSQVEGLIFYDSVNKCFTAFNDITGSSQQLGREGWRRVYNDTGVEILDGKVCYLSGYNLSAGMPEVSLAKADIAATALSTIGFATSNIPIGGEGEITLWGDVKGLDTSSCSGQEALFLSADTAGEYTSTAPDSPNYLVRLGNCEKVDASTGIISVKVDINTNTQGVIKIFNGSILEDHTTTVTSNGTTITLSLEQNGGGNLSLFFDGIFSVFDTTPAATVTLAPGTDEEPQRNWIYIPKSTMTLTANTTGFPTNEQVVAIADVFCESAASIQTDGPLKWQAWTDHLSDDVGQGHLAHVNKWIRSQNATYISGGAVTATGGASTLDIAVAGGLMLQLHEHPIDVFDTATGSDIYVVNDPVTAYNKSGDLTGANDDSEGVSLTGRYYSVVIWISGNEQSDEDKLFCNLPSGSYNTSAGAIADSSRSTNFSIPAEFKGTGLLLARVTIRNQGDTTYTIVETEDLRGLTPSTAAGGGGGSGTDSDAIHDNVAGEIVLITEKTAIVNADLLLIEDSEDSNNKKRVTRGNFLGAAGSGDVVGPGNATDEAFARFDTTTGKIIQNGVVTGTDTGVVNTPTGGDYQINGSSVAVTNGDSHDHTGGDGAQIDHTGLSNTGTNTHGQIDTHISASSAHGISGDVVGTTDTQTVSNKTLTDIIKLQLKAATQLTIATGAVTVTQAYHKIGGEGAADDDLATINGGVEGQFTSIIPANASQNITIVQTGNIVIPDGNDYLIPDDGLVELLFDGANWRLVAFSSFSINDLTENTSIAQDDEFPQRDTSASIDKKVTIGTMRQDIPNEQTGTTYTLELPDAGKTVRMNNASANVVTIPTNATVAIPINSTTMIMQIGIGTTTITGDTGVTVNEVSGGSIVSSGQRSIMALIKSGTDTWDVIVSNSNIITENTNIYVATTGSDTTGDGTIGNPFATLGRSMEYLNDFSIGGNALVTIFTADGTYNTSSSININHPDANRIQIFGNSSNPENVIIKATSAIALFVIGTAQPIFIRYVTLDGDSTGSTGILVLVGGSISIRDTTIKNFTSAGFNLNESGTCKLRTSTIDNCVIGLVSQFTAKAVMNSCIITNCSSFGVYAQELGAISLVTAITCTDNGTGFFAGAHGTIRLPSSVTVSGNTTDYSPALTTADTPIYGNDMGIISQ